MFPLGSESETVNALFVPLWGRFWGLTGDIEGVRGPDNDGTRTQASECGHGALRCCRAVAGLPAREGLNGGCSYAIPRPSSRVYRSQTRPHYYVAGRVVRGRGTRWLCISRDV